MALRSSAFRSLAIRSLVAGARRFAPLAIAGLAAFAISGCATSGSGKKADTGIGSSEFKTGTGVDSAGEYGNEPEKVRELATIYFDYDSSSIRPDARPTLKSNASAIESHREWKTVVLEGHTDERGSEEYNIALGERRANATKQYLQDLGVPSDRMQVVSFGESQPAVQGHDESAWRWNRRVEFRVTR
jgi:peptidoglycan-associated lipoprotein